MGDVNFLLPLIPLMFLGVASWTDIKTHKIKNWNSYTMAIVGIIVAIFYQGLSSAVIAIVAGILAGILLISIPGISTGGGDIKIVVASGIWVGAIIPSLYLVAISIVLFSVGDLCRTFFKVGIKGALRALFNEIKQVVSFHAIYGRGDGDTPARLPFAPFIAVSYLIIVAFQEGVLWI